MTARRPSRETCNEDETKSGPLEIQASVPSFNSATSRSRSSGATLKTLISVVSLTSALMLGVMALDFVWESEENGALAPSASAVASRLRRLGRAGDRCVNMDMLREPGHEGFVSA